MSRINILRKRLEAYFAIGATVPSYGGLDKVLGFEWNNGDWRVKVQAINKDGSIDKVWPYPRTHCTRPNNI